MDSRIAASSLPNSIAKASQADFGPSHRMLVFTYQLPSARDRANDGRRQGVLDDRGA
jgi:hypothetical protein